MAANLVIESSDEQVFATGATVTYTKPTGLAVDDLLVAVNFWYEPSVGSVTDFATPAGWTDLGGYVNDNSSSRVKQHYFMKVADSGDVAASTFAFTATGADKTGGELFRISGERTADPSGGITGEGLITSANPTFSVSLTPDQNETLYILGYTVGTGGSTVDVDTPVIDATNPTWTEQFSDSPSSGVRAVIFTGIVAATDPITTVDQTETDTSASTDWSVGLLAINDSGDAAGTVGFVASTGSKFDVVGAADANGTVAFQGSSTQAEFAVVGSVEHPTEWTDESKESTTWTNESKL